MRVEGLMDAVIRTSDYDHIVVLPDLHGDFEGTIRALWLARFKITSEFLLFPDFKSAFENQMFDEPFDSFFSDLSVAVVALGDYVDRGPYSQECIAAVLAIPDVLGWSVLPLYGNHEIMAMLGQSGPYLHPHETPRGDMFSRGEIFEQIHANMLGMVRLEGPGDGTNTLFVHGGIDTDWLESNDLLDPDINVINSKIQSIVATDPAKLNDVDGGSFLWTRLLAEQENICDAYLEGILSYFKVARIVLGHTPQKTRRIRSRCDGKVVLADVGLSRWMYAPRRRDVDGLWGGQPMALIFTIDSTTNELSSIHAHYSDIGSGLRQESVEIYKRPSETFFDVLVRVALELEPDLKRLRSQVDV